MRNSKKLTDTQQKAMEARMIVSHAPYRHSNNKVFQFRNSEVAGNDKCWKLVSDPDEWFIAYTYAPTIMEAEANFKAAGLTTAGFEYFVVEVI